MAQLHEGPQLGLLATAEPVLRVGDDADEATAQHVLDHALGRLAVEDAVVEGRCSSLGVLEDGDVREAVGS